MNGLLSKCLVVIAFTLGGAAKGQTDEIMQATFLLPTYPQEDRDLSIAQNFLLDQAFLEVDPKQKESCKFIFSFEGKLTIEGKQDMIHGFAGALGKAIEKVIGEEVSEESVQVRKEESEAFSNSLAEKVLLEEIKPADLVCVRDSLFPLVQMLYEASSVADESPLLTLIAEYPEYHHFYSLPISQADQNKISELIKKMADYGYVRLLKKRKEMEELGDAVCPIHPLRFIGYIYSHPSLKKRMPQILNDPLGRKKNGFLNGSGNKEGFAQRMTKEMRRGNLMRYLPGFAQLLGLSEQELASFFHSYDWEGLLTYLTKKC